MKHKEKGRLCSRVPSGNFGGFTKVKLTKDTTAHKKIRQKSLLQVLEPLFTVLVSDIIDLDKLKKLGQHIK